MSLIMGVSISKGWLIFVIIYILFIYLSLPFARNVLNYMYTFLGKEILHSAVNLTLLIFVLYIVYKLVKKGLKAIIITLAVLLIVFLFAKVWL